MGQNVLLTGKSVTDRTKVKEILVDESGDIVIITHEHSKVHQGKLFGVGYLNQSVADNGDIELLILTPPNDELHTYLKLVVGGDAIFTAFEDPTVSAAGTSISSINHNRSSSNTCGCTITHTPTLTDDGTPLWEEFVAGGSGSGGQGSRSTPGAVQGVATEQVVMKANSYYLFRLQNIAGLTEPLQIMLSYYPVPSHG